MNQNLIRSKYETAEETAVKFNSFIYRQKKTRLALRGRVDIILFTKLRPTFNHLTDHKFKHNFKDTVNLVCFCGKEIESMKHCLLLCQHVTL